MPSLNIQVIIRDRVEEPADEAINSRMAGPALSIYLRFWIYGNWGATQQNSVKTDGWASYEIRQ